MPSGSAPAGLLPDTLIAGDTWRWLLDLPAHPATAGWRVTVLLRGASALDVESEPAPLPGGGDGPCHVLQTAASRTAELAPGLHRYLVRATRAATPAAPAMPAMPGGATGDAEREVVTVAAGTLTLVANFASAAEGTLVPHAERALRLVEAALEGRLVDQTEAYTILGRSLERTPVAELRKLRAQYAHEVARLRRGSPFATIRVTLGAPIGALPVGIRRPTHG